MTVYQIKMLKYIKKEISKPLTLIINQMLDSGNIS